PEPCRSAAAVVVAGVVPGPVVVATVATVAVAAVGAARAAVVTLIVGSVAAVVVVGVMVDTVVGDPTRPVPAMVVPDVVRWADGARGPDADATVVEPVARGERGAAHAEAQDRRRADHHNLAHVILLQLAGARSERLSPACLEVG